MVKYTISNKGVKLKDLYNDESKWLARGKTLQIYEDEQVDINEDFLTKFAAEMPMVCNAYILRVE
ncbi:hypothetical protein [Candidatus Tisiphia endosymbiont of Nemotelus uliginosus]|uniref:hypothetical protein n=1 Tax=Candidatus Tisiphia endosymbiont of Nemotelus uliginosus TaxID=3077926 RepID=UPI0035C8D0CE